MEETYTSSSSQKNRRIAKNTLILYFRMILTMLITLYTSRVILNVLGIEDYGIYNVVGGLVSMLSFLNSAMSNATQRFLAIEIGKKDIIQLRKTFNATQNIHIGIAVIIIIIAETIGIWFVKTFMVIPVERIDAAIWVYHFSILSLIVSIIQVPYNALIIAYERMNVYAYVSILEVFLKLLIAFVLTWISFDNLKLYGLLHFGVVFVIATIYRIYVLRKYSDESKFVVVKEKKLYIVLFSYSGWSLFSHVAYTVQGQGVNILLNMFFGPVVNAARGIATQVQGAVRSFSTNFQTAMNPQIIKSYAVNDKKYMFSLVNNGSKYSFCLLLFLSLPIMLEINQILKLWLITVPNYTSIFTVLVLIAILIDCISGPLTTAIQATGKIKIYQLITGSFRILILPLSYFFLKNGFSPEITLYINIVISTITLFIRLYIVWYLLKFPIFNFIKDNILKNVFVFLLSLSIPLLIRFIMDENTFRLIVIVFVSLIWSASVMYILVFNSSEKVILKGEVKKILKRYC